MDHIQNHVVQEAHKIGTELRHDNFSQAHKELNKEAHNPHEFQKLLTDINHDLKQHHQHPLSVHHDKAGHISHVDFGKHDIYNAHHSHKPGEHAHTHDGAHKSKIHSGDDLAVARLHEHDPKAKPEDAHKGKIKSGDDLAVSRLHEHDAKNADGSPKATDAHAAAKPGDAHADAKPGGRQDFLTDAQRKQLATEGNAAPADGKAHPADGRTATSGDKAKPNDGQAPVTGDKANAANDPKDDPSNKTHPAETSNSAKTGGSHAGADAAAASKAKPVDPDRAKVEEEFRKSVKDGNTIRQMDPALQNESRTFLHNLESNGVSGDQLQTQRDKLVELNNRPGENLATKKADIQQLNKLFAPPGRDI